MTENRTVCEIYLHGMRQPLCQDQVELFREEATTIRQSIYYKS